MELEEFVKRAIVDIVTAAVEAHKVVQAHGAAVNPTNISFRPDQLAGAGYTDDHNITRLIEFDVAVTASEGTGTKGGIGVVLGAVALGSQGQSQQQREAISRIRFTVPILLPGFKNPHRT